MDGNLLYAETSPYLLQHRDNPVHWRPWGPDALAEAQRTGKPILLSIGYAACHWCHVMAHESFEDPDIAAVMNQLFVNIKVDREERPDIDQIYMSALQALGEQGGWPLTMFLTPQGEPVWGGTYFPRTARFGRPAFVDVLQSIAHAFAEQGDRIAQNRDALRDHLAAPPDHAGSTPTAEMLEEASGIVARLIDREHGGLGGSPKFPQPTLLEFLTRAADRTGNPLYRDLVTLSLRNMVQGGIYDHVGGGLSRYSVDDRWLVPHFEKMLYDNALLLERLTAAWLATGEELFRVRIDETITWLRREMRVEGAFAASLDADSPGGEGAYYVWRPDEIIAVLGSEAAAEFCRVYDITPGGNFEGASIPNRLATQDSLGAEAEARLASARAILLQERQSRIGPGRDDKILADWNGFLIAALARAGSALGRPDWVIDAVETYRFIRATMMRDGRLCHSYRAGAILPVGFASDYGAMIRAALALHDVTLDAAYVDDAARFAGTLDKHYWDASVLAYRLTADDVEALVARPLPLFDDSIPSANAVITTGLARLASLTGNAGHRDRVHEILHAHIGGAGQVLGKAGLFNALDQTLNGTEIAVVVPAGASPDAMLGEIRKSWRESFVLTVLSGPAQLPVDHPAFGKTAIDNRPTVYVCRGQTCSVPITEPAGFAGFAAPR